MTNCLPAVKMRQQSHVGCHQQGRNQMTVITQKFRTTTRAGKIRGGVLALAAVSLLTALPIQEAQAHDGHWYPIEGSTTWDSPCSWATSENTRYVTAPGSSIWLNLTSVGKLGVKFRVKYVNTGKNSVTKYFPPIATDQKIGEYQKTNEPFRTQFSCIKPRKNIWDRPSTDFEGSIHY